LPGSRNERLVQFALAELVWTADRDSVVKQLRLASEKSRGKDFVEKISTRSVSKGNCDAIKFSSGSCECPSLVQPVSSIFCTRGYALPRGLFHKLFNIFVENSSPRGRKIFGTKFPIADFFALRRRAGARRVFLTAHPARC